jgi:hypothetical protein
MKLMRPVLTSQLAEVSECSNNRVFFDLLHVLYYNCSSERAFLNTGNASIERVAYLLKN